MGIKELWGILAPYCDRKPLYELQGKVVAIDLAGWVCESLNVVDYMVQPKFYLRNLFFRTCYLLMSGVVPVFVLEGEAPKLKHDIIAKRNEMQFMGARPRDTQPEGSNKLPKKDKGRSRFNHVLKLCEQLIETMGIQCVQGPGEAEAFCAYLNNAGMVDGVISQDSDCFAYGAVRVFRNFSVSTQGSAAAAGGAVDIYDLNRVSQSIDLGPNKMVVLALLCGCDYCPEGVGGVGKDSVLKLLEMYKEHEILQVLKTWRAKDYKYSELQVRVDDKNICSNCGHYGKVQAHTKKGCSLCKTGSGCDESLWKEERQRIKTELLIRKKALADENFPSKDIIDEFLNRPASLPKLDLSWQQPKMIKFLNLMGKHLQWEEIYCFQKLLPLLTRWQLINKSNEERGTGNFVITPDCIKKKRTPKGIASYEIIWKDDSKFFEGLLPDEQIELFIETNLAGLESLWSTTEPADLVEKSYPELVEAFILSKAKPKKASKRAASAKTPKKNKKNKKSSPNSSLNDLSALLSAVTEIEKDKPKKKRTRKVAVKGIQMIEKFMKCVPNADQDKSFSNMTTSFDGTHNDSNLSKIINGIVCQSPQIKQFRGMMLHYSNGDNFVDAGSSECIKCPIENLDLNKTQDELMTSSNSIKERKGGIFKFKKFQFGSTEISPFKFNSSIRSQLNNNSLDDLDPLIMKNTVMTDSIKKKSFSMESLYRKMDSIDRFIEEQDRNSSEDKENENIEMSFPNTPIQSSTPSVASRFLKRERFLSKQLSLIQNSIRTTKDSSDKTAPNESHFFGNLTEEPDLFELSLQVKDVEESKSDIDEFSDPLDIMEFSLDLKPNSEMDLQISNKSGKSSKKRLSDKFEECANIANEIIVIDDSD